MVTEGLVQEVSQELYSAALRRVPPDTLDAARERETQDSAQATLDLMVRSARLAEEKDAFVCSDSGVPSYVVEIGGSAQWRGDLKAAISRGFAHLVETVTPPLLKHVNNPLTNERGGMGKDMPSIAVDLIGDADYIDITCVRKALGSGRWASIGTLISPSLEEIETCVLGRDPRGGLAALPAGRDRCRHRRQFQSDRQARQPRHLSRNRFGQSAPAARGDGRAADRSGQRDRLRADGRRRQHHGAARGNSIYQRLEDEAHARLPQILATLAQRRAAAEGNRS